jgi:hypothetical protein
MDIVLRRVRDVAHAVPLPFDPMRSNGCYPFAMVGSCARMRCNWGGTDRVSTYLDLSLDHTHVLPVQGKMDR